jgi:hypothetical protein
MFYSLREYVRQEKFKTFLVDYATIGRKVERRRQRITEDFFFEVSEYSFF